MKRVLVCALAALVAGCGDGPSNRSGSGDPLSAARAAIISRDFTDAVDHAERAVAQNPESPDPYFELARAEALRGNAGSAEENLGKALDRGLGDAGQKLRDPAFAKIRDSESFRQLVERAEPGSAPRTAEAREESIPTVEITDDQVRAGDVAINTDF